MGIQRAADTLPTVRPIVAILAFVPLLAACGNPFLTNYRGARCPTLSSAHVAVQAPADATLIGTSDFRTETAVGDVQAIGAARAVGADIVQWDRAFLRDDVVLDRNAALAGGMDDTTATGATAPPGEGTWYRIHARFWRTNALGSLPTPPPAGDASTTEPETESTP